MKAPHRSEAASSGEAVGKTISHLELCPNAPECRRWTATDEGLIWCCHCWQTFTRADAARILEGRIHE